LTGIREDLRGKELWEKRNLKSGFKKWKIIK
jgi:hypothetical protein